VLQERDANRSALLSFRTNDRVESDKLKKAIRDAVAPKDTEIAQLRRDNERLNRERLIDENNIRELSRWKDENAKKDLEIASYRATALAAEQMEKVMEDQLVDVHQRLASIFFRTCILL